MNAVVAQARALSSAERAAKQEQAKVSLHSALHLLGTALGKLDDRSEQADEAMDKNEKIAGDSNYDVMSDGQDASQSKPEKQPNVTMTESFQISIKIGSGFG